MRPVLAAMSSRGTWRYEAIIHAASSRPLSPFPFSQPSAGSCLPSSGLYGSATTNTDTAAEPSTAPASSCWGMGSRLRKEAEGGGLEERPAPYSDVPPDNNSTSQCTTAAFSPLKRRGALYLMMRNTTMRYDTNDVFFLWRPGWLLFLGDGIGGCAIYILKYPRMFY